MLKHRPILYSLPLCFDGTGKTGSLLAVPILVLVLLFLWYVWKLFNIVSQDMFVAYKFHITHVSINLKSYFIELDINYLDLMCIVWWRLTATNTNAILHCKYTECKYTHLLESVKPLPYPDSKIRGANIGPTWGRQDPCWSHVGPMKIVIWVILANCKEGLRLPYLHLNANAVWIEALAMF